MSTDERMEKMEGQLSRMRWVNRCLIGCIVVALGVWFISKTFGPKTEWAQPGAKEIRANNFVLEDDNGKPRAVLGMVKDWPRLALLDESGKAQASLMVSENGPRLALYDEKGKSRAALAVLEGGPALAFADENGKPIWGAP